MGVQKLVPNDLRVKYESTQVRGKTYSYMLGEPEGTPKDTIVLVHGFPDHGFGWRCQVPYIMSLGYRVLVPNMLGYGGTDAPAALEEYTLKNISADINELARRFVGDGQIILGGHDWGGFLVWRTAMWHPELIKAVFSVCTPFSYPSKEFIALEDMIAAGKLRNFTYQLQFRGPDVETRIQGEDKVRQFLNAMYGGLGPQGEVGFKTSEGVQFDNLAKLGPSVLVSKEEIDHYVQQYMLHEAPQLRGPLNWYRTRKLNHEEELPLTDASFKFEMPALFIAATKDAALPPAMSAGMDAHFANLTRGEVNASHWALTQAADEVNEKLGAWLEGVQKGSVKASL